MRTLKSLFKVKCSAAAYCTLILALVPISLCVTELPAEAKKWTVTQRVEKLSAEIDEGRRANELTTKQVETLKQDVLDIKDRMEKMKSKNGGVLSVPDTKKLHDQMTELSVKIVRCRLNNVYSN